MIPQGNTLKGIGLVLAATLIFAISDVLTKRLVTSYGVILVVALRYVVNLGLLTAVLGPRDGRALWQTNRTIWVMLRGLCLVVASLTMGLALQRMPVAETVAIIYIAPVLVVIFGWLLLGETVALAGWLGAVVGFLGVLLIVRPGTGLDPVGVALCLANAACGTAYHLLTRVLARTETMAAMLFHTALVGTVAFWGVLPFQTLSALPSWADLALMGLLGALAAVGHFLFTAAYREAPASTLAPINYLHLVWAAVLGWVVYGHLPDGWTIVGMALVAGAGIAVALRAKFTNRQTVNPDQKNPARVDVERIIAERAET